MKPQTEELLYELMWTLSFMARPSIHTLEESFESWAYRNGLLCRIHRLQALQLLECSDEGPDPRIVRLTEEGLRHAAGGIYPPERWSRPWDGRWRVLVFDVPNVHASYRVQLVRILRRHRFGGMQKSVWITPDPPQNLMELLRAEDARADSLVLLDASPCGGEEHAVLVKSAWNFKAINKRYDVCLQLLERASQLGVKKNRAQIRAWLGIERRTWKEACSIDPFLPEPLLPGDYLGRKAWETRQSAIPRLYQSLI